MLLRNTLLYNILFIVLNIVIPVTLAVLINQIYSRIASKAYQTMMFFPYFLSWVVVSYFVYAFLNPDKGSDEHHYSGSSAAIKSCGILSQNGGR